MAYKDAVEHGENIRDRILDAIIGYVKEHGYSPSVREIGEMVGLKSTSSVQTHLKKMMDSGMLETDAEFSTPRAIGYRDMNLLKKEEMFRWQKQKDLC